MKSLKITLLPVSRHGRSREGAWIEIGQWTGVAIIRIVAPARERGLKLTPGLALLHVSRRSREGAWIEMLGTTKPMKSLSCRSREGAWIEIHPCRRRRISSPAVAPARERGLKYLDKLEHPQTQCRSREGAWIEI